MTNGVSLSSNTQQGHKLDLAKHHLSPFTGFVPSPAPLPALPPPFTPWDALATRLPSLLHSSNPSALHSAIRDLPLLPAAELVALPQLRRAYVVLGFLIHGYAWSGTQDKEVRIPAQLAQPYLEVCERLGLGGRETLAYAGLCSWNWEFVGEKEGKSKWELENMKCLVTFSGTRDEEVFYLVPVLVEREGGRGVGGLYEVLGLIQGEGGDKEQIDATKEKMKSVLNDLKACLVKMQGLVKLLHDECDPTVFWTQVRPYLAGGKGGLGWIFELADGTEVRRWCVGGSAAQSATFPFLDAALGIKHAKLGGEVSVFEEMREYMPVEQRDFLDKVESMRPIAEFVEEHRGDVGLTEAYNGVLQELAKWRSKHIGVVTTHIVNQARKEKKQTVSANQVTDGLSVKDESDLQGTGGSALIPFLKGARQHTEAARVSV